MAIKKLCVFCGSNTGQKKEYVQVTQELGKTLAERGITLIYGGGNVGLMGCLSSSVIESGGKVIGVIPRVLFKKEIADEEVSQVRKVFHLKVVKSMHERKAVMADYADGFVALPGGIGTMEEFFEVFTWAQLGLHKKPFGILNVGNYYQDIIRFFDRAISEGFLKDKNRKMLFVEKSVGALLDKFEHYHPPSVGKWISPKTR